VKKEKQDDEPTASASLAERRDALIAAARRVDESGSARGDRAPSAKWVFWKEESRFESSGKLA
jgi:hypothetical protein